MTVVIDIGFPFGYVHATPWSTHVNEGSVEWPLSPWRLLRALVSTWQTRCPNLPDDVVVSVVGALAERPPAIRAAARTEASIRTYLPSEEHRSGISGDTDLAVDAFAAVAPGTGLSYRWSAELDERGREILTQIVDALPYLGRAESVCLATARFEEPGGDWVEPRDDSRGLGARTLVPATPFDLDMLCVSIRSMRKGGRLHPPGAAWVRYPLPRPLVGTVPSRPTSRAGRVPAVRLALSGAAPVSVRQTVVLAEAIRTAAMSQYGRLYEGGVSQMLAGKDTDGTPLAGHRHAHWLPLDLDGDRLLDAVLVWAPEGLDEKEVASLGAIRRLYFHGGDGLGAAASLGVGFEVSGAPSDLVVGSALGASARWRSVTPFLPQRHRHRKRQSLEDFLADCVGRELVARGIETPFSLELERQTSWGSFRRHRRTERLRDARPGYGLILHFEEPVMGPGFGPLCLGSLSHFGMGRFVNS